MRFNTSKELRDHAAKAAASDYARAITISMDQNPYFTDGARNCWERGFTSAPAASWERPEWDYQYQRGAQAKLGINRLTDAFNNLPI